MEGGVSDLAVGVPGRSSISPHIASRAPGPSHCSANLRLIDSPIRRRRYACTGPSWKSDLLKNSEAPIALCKVALPPELIRTPIGPQEGRAEHRAFHQSAKSSSVPNRQSKFERGKPTVRRPIGYLFPRHAVQRSRSAHGGNSCEPLQIRS